MSFVDNGWDVGVKIQFFINDNSKVTSLIRPTQYMVADFISLVWIAISHANSVCFLQLSYDIFNCHFSAQAVSLFLVSLLSILFNYFGDIAKNTIMH